MGARPFVFDGSPRLLTRFFGLLCMVLIAVRAVPMSGFVISLGLAVYALKGPKETIQSFTLLAFLLILGNANVSLGRWLVLFAGFGRMLWDTLIKGGATPRIMLPLLVFSGTVFILSLTSSLFPVVSMFKVVSFVLGVSTIMMTFHQTSHLRDYWLLWFFTFCVFILVASLPLLALGQGYALNSGFKGILSHPQTFGPVAAPITAFMTGLFFFQGHRSKLILLSIGLGWFGMYLSLSRTSILATALGLCIAMAIGFMIKTQTWQPQVQRVLSQGYTLVIIVAIVIVTALQWSTIQERATEFLLKDDANEEMEGNALIGSLENSRGNLIRRSYTNFLREPLTGIGFGIPSYAYWAPDVFYVETGFMGLPIGASVEKGFMPSAVLEETGIIGTALVIWLLISLLKPVIRNGSLTLFWMIVVCLLVNLGEMIFFSLGGMGFFFWLIMGFCYTYAMSAPQRQRPQPRFYQ